MRRDRTPGRHMPHSARHTNPTRKRGPVEGRPSLTRRVSVRYCATEVRWRGGMTLTEVLLALAIFVGALAVLSKLIHIGVRASEFAQLHTRAVLLAESKMGELTAGIEPISSSGEVFLEDPAWRWQLSVSDGPVAGLKWVSITVVPASGGELANNREPVEFTLGRWMMDPEYMASLELATTETQ